MNESILSKLFSFRLVSLCGVLMAFYIFSLRTDERPLSFFIYNVNLYIVASLIALAVRVLLWIVVDRGTFYEFFHRLKQTFDDCVLINVILLCTLSFLFLVTSILNS